MGQIKLIRQISVALFLLRYALRSAEVLFVEEKCNLQPSQSVIWLGLVCNMNNSPVLLQKQD